MNDKTKEALLMGAVFSGALLGGLLYHMFTCQQCRKKGSIDEIAAASAEINGPRVVP